MFWDYISLSLTYELCFILCLTKIFTYDVKFAPKFSIGFVFFDKLNLKVVLYYKLNLARYLCPNAIINH